MTAERRANDDLAKLAALRAALVAGIAELDSGLGEETTVEELMAEVLCEAGLERPQ